MTELPDTFLKRMEGLLGEAYPAFLASYDAPAARALHTGAKMQPARLAALLGERVSPAPIAPDAFYFHTSESVGGNPLHHAGAFYMQEPSAMLPVLCAQIRSGERVLDLCAAPGGKSTQIANRLGEGGLLVANEYVGNRCVILAGNLERMGIREGVVTNTDAATLARLYPAFFDTVLIDAPCSGEGLFRREPAAVAEWSQDNVVMCAARQREILDRGAETVRPGGCLVYSTCTFSPEENEENVLWFLRTHPAFIPEQSPEEVRRVTAPGLCPEDSALGRAIAGTARRAYPHLAPGEGQFMIRLRRASDDTSVPAITEVPREKKKGHAREKESDVLRPLTREEETVFGKFLRDVGISPDTLPTPCVFKGGISLLAADCPTPPEVTYARGVYAGTVEKGRLIPGHFFFSAYGSLFARRVELAPDDPRLLAYLRGETFPCTLDDGWAVVTVAGAPLGGIKVSGGVAKNHYPKGLRLRT